MAKAGPGGESGSTTTKSKPLSGPISVNAATGGGNAPPTGPTSVNAATGGGNAPKPPISEKGTAAGTPAGTSSTGAYQSTPTGIGGEDSQNPAQSQGGYLAGSPNNPPAYISTNEAPTPPGTTTGTGPGGNGPPTPTGLPPASYTQTDQQIISEALSSVGLGAMSSWANGLMTTLIGQGMDFSDAQNYLLSSLNAPKDANGQIDQAALDAFNAAFPGFNQRIVNGYSNGDPGDTNPLGALGAYISYNTQLQEMANAAGLPTGFMSGTEIGNLWAGDVSTDEVSTRINQGWADYNSAPQQTKNFLENDLGISAGSMVAYYLNPDNALPAIQQSFNTASVQAGAQIAGFDNALSQSTAAQVAAFLQSGTDSNGMPSQVNASQIASQLGESIGPGLGSAAQLAQAGFEQQLPGQLGSEQTVNEGQLLGASLEGNAADVAAVTKATGSRTAKSQGGGGFTTTAEGAVGLGYANS